MLAGTIYTSAANSNGAPTGNGGPIAILGSAFNSGYRGRIGIYEVMRVTDKLRRLITVKSTEDQLREAAVAGGMITLGEDGLAKVKSGITTPEEVMRATKDQTIGVAHPL